VSLPRVVLLRGHNVNQWDLRAWEELSDRFDVRVLVTGSNRFDLSGLRLPVERVRAVRDLVRSDLAVKAPGDRYLGLARHLEGADLVHSAELGVWFSHQPAQLKERLGFRLVLTVWETIPFRATYRAFRGRAYREATIPAVDLFLAATERARECLLLEDVPADRIEVCPPGVDVERFAGARGEPERLAVSPGRLVWEKGHQDVLRALAALRRGLVAGEPPRVLIVGTGPEEGRLRRYAADLGVADLVELRAGVPHDEMPAVLGRAACVVLASLATPLWEEQFGMVLAEAIAAGVPVIAAASGAIPEVVGEAAVLVRPGDWLGLARALAGPLPAPDPALAARYSAGAAAGRIAAAYDRVLGGS
jgi:glycosyltransferase involved in cell wall biosynthesis